MSPRLRFWGSVNNKWNCCDSVCIQTRHMSELHYVSKQCSMTSAISLGSLISSFVRDQSIHTTHSITSAFSFKMFFFFLFTLRMHTFVGFVAIMHYNSYVPELDLKPVQFVFNHQVSMLIIHIPTPRQQMVYVTYLQTNVWWVQ